MMAKLIGAGVVVLLIALLLWWKRSDISSAEAHQLVKEGAQLIDVRSPGEYAAGHVEGARNIPVGEIAARSGELGATDRPIILYCASGTRSAMAASKLRSAGFSRVYNLGGMSNW
jgi:rhodanese-related sulfurtransferase